MAYITVNANSTLAAGNSYAVTANGLTLTLPAGSAGDRIEVFQGTSSLASTSIAPASGAKINGNAANATLNVIIPNFFIVLVYINST